MKKLYLPTIWSLLLACLFADPSPATAQSYWDANHTDASAGNNGAGGGSGSWDNATSDWWFSGHSDTVWPGNIAYFAGTPGTVTLGANVSAEGLVFDAGGYTLSGSDTVTFTGTGVIDVFTGAATISCILGDAETEGLNFSGPGTLILSGNQNTYPGSTYIDNGELQTSADATTAGTAANLGETPAAFTPNNIELAGALSASATFTLYQTRGILLLANSTFDVGTQTGPAQTLTVAGAISQPDNGSLGITKTSAGILDLTGVNTFTGNITISGGTLTIGGSGSLHSGNYAGNIATTANTPVEGTPPASFNYASSAAQTLSGVISGGGLVAQNGAGTLTLTGANTYTGDTIINAGSLALSGIGSINDSPLIFIYDSGTFDVSASSTYTLNSGTTLFAAGNGTGAGSTAAAIKGNASGMVNLGSQPINLYLAPSSYSGDTTHQPLDITQGALTLDNNPIWVTNISAGALGAGIYNLIHVAGGIIHGAPNSSVIVTGGYRGWGSGLVAGASAIVSVNGTEVVMTVGTPPTPTTTTTPSSIAAGQPFTATVSPVPDGGVVQFFGNGAQLGVPVAVNTTTGAVALTSPQSMAGSYTDFTAVYSGDADYGASASATETLVVTNLPAVQIVSATVVGTGLKVCWPTVSGVVYNVLTNGNLTHDTPASWVQVSSVSPVTGDGNVDCVIIPTATLPSTNIFVLIKQP